MNLDNTLKQLQHSNALAGQLNSIILIIVCLVNRERMRQLNLYLGTSVSGKEKKDEIIKPCPTKPENIKDTDMTDLAEMLKTNS